MYCIYETLSYQQPSLGSTFKETRQDVNAAADAFDVRWDACVSKCSLM
jgi:hypothetical protein